ncbi:hypothetical protein P7E43_03475 [Enterococcus gallinarum]|nr:hypothetical protein [Enterococcus gallinarum]MDT2729919.1 hypothetical protein [Enterococcus gallinarum]
MSYRLGRLAQESSNVVLSVLVREIRALEKNIKDLENQTKLAKYAGLYSKVKQVVTEFQLETTL